MSKRLNLTPQELQYIVNSIEEMRNTIIHSANMLMRDTTNIQSKWDDDQFEKFKETMLMFNQSLHQMSEQLENEKQRVIRYQQDSQRTTDNWGN